MSYETFVCVFASVSCQHIVNNVHRWIIPNDWYEVTVLFRAGGYLLPLRFSQRYFKSCEPRRVRQFAQLLCAQDGVSDRSR